MQVQNASSYRRWEVGDEIHPDFLIMREMAEVLVPDETFPLTAVRFTLYQKQGITYLQAMNASNLLQAQYLVSNPARIVANDFESDKQRLAESIRVERNQWNKMFNRCLCVTIAATLLAGVVTAFLLKVR